MIGALIMLAALAAYYRREMLRAKARESKRQDAFDAVRANDLRELETTKQRLEKCQEDRMALTAELGKWRRWAEEAPDG